MVSAFVKRQPWRLFATILSVWIILLVVNFALFFLGYEPGTSYTFPISIFVGPTIHVEGLLYLVLFAAAFIVAVGFAPRLNVAGLWFAGLALTVFGNLIQGGVDPAFYAPFYHHGIQYYHDALKIESWRAWLADFNAMQPELLMHSRTHPPFAVLFHYACMGGQLFSIPALAVAFVGLASLIVPFVYLLLLEMGVSPMRARLLTVFFAALPAFNIYSAVVLDAPIAMFATLFLLGTARLVRRGPAVLDVVLILVGFVGMNLLTFGGIFLMAVTGLLALWRLAVQRRWDIAVLGASMAGLLLVLEVVFRAAFGYSHVDAFMTAARIENPDGFRGFAVPLEYVMTRIENVAEIAFFLSLGAFALVCRPANLRLALLDWRQPENALFWSGVISLAAMFAAGTFNTGETARICLFIYPYLVLLYRNVDETDLYDLLVWAGLQTAGMQFFGGYFW